MKILQALRHLDNAIDFKNLGYNEAWQTLKTVVLAQQTTNSSSPKLPCMACSNGDAQSGTRNHPGQFCHWCGRQLRAG